MIKPKTCRQCKAKFTPRNSLQIACSLDCAKEIGRKKTIKDAKTVQNTQKRELIAQKDAIKTRSQWLKEVQVVFNAYIRGRDEKLPCISCGRYHTGQYHAGHYRTTAAAPELRFNEFNVWKQCAPCNNHKHGNITEYRINLVKKLGLENVEWLESKHEPCKYTIAELKELKERFKSKLKELKS